MNFKSMVFTLRDIKRIMEGSSIPGLGRWDLGRTYGRLKLLSRSQAEGKQRARILGDTVNYLDPENLFLLYQDIFLGRIYQANIDKRDPIIIDCGSNIGLSILFFKRQFPDSRIIGFEPHPILFEILQENIECNQVSGVSVHQTAVSDRAGSIEFFLNEDNPGSLNMGLIRREQSAKSITVETVPLSNYITGRVDLLKLDIEGSEERVLRDLEANDRLQYISNIVCEYHHHIDRGVDRLSQVLGILERAGFGYQVSAYSKHPPNIEAYQDVMIYAYNRTIAKNSGAQRR